MQEPVRNLTIRSLALEQPSASLLPGLSAGAEAVASSFEQLSASLFPGLSAGMEAIASSVGVVQFAQLERAIRPLEELANSTAVLRAFAAQSAGLDAIYRQHLQFSFLAARFGAWDGLAGPRLAGFDTALKLGFEVAALRGEVVEEAVRQQTDEPEAAAAGRRFTSEAARRRARTAACSMVAGIVFSSCFYILIVYPEVAEVLSTAGVTPLEVAGVAFVLTRLAFDRLYPPDDKD